MALFLLIAGRHGTGSKKGGTQKIYESAKGADREKLNGMNLIETENPKEVEVFRKNPEKFKEVTGDPRYDTKLRMTYAPVAKQEPEVEEEAAFDPSSLDKMTIDQLREFATSNHVDLKGAIRKNDIVATLKAWYASLVE